MKNIDILSIIKIYTGSVQELFSVPGFDDILISKTTEGGSVFDVGTIFNIKGSGVSRAALRHKVFSSLNNRSAWAELRNSLKESSNNHYMNDPVFQDQLDYYVANGAKTHHLGMIDKKTGVLYNEKYPVVPSELTLIKKFIVEKPEREKVLLWSFFDYSKYKEIKNYVVPLEYIVRFGITSGSSVLRKYDSLGEDSRIKYADELGGFDKIYPWQIFESPVVDFTTKYEPEDRNISIQEAALISGLNGELFSRSLVMSILGSMMVAKIFREMGLFLWDLKWEIGVSNKDLYYVDTIDTDSVRVTVNVKKDGRIFYVHFNKQAMRDYYKLIHPEWYQGVLHAKECAQKAGKSFVEVLREGQLSGKYPEDPVIEEEFMKIQELKMSMIEKYIYGETMDFDVESKRIANMEVEYYFSKESRQRYSAINSFFL